MAMRTGNRLFLLIGKHSHATLTKNLIATMPKIVAFLERHPAPFLAKIYCPNPPTDAGLKPGTVVMWIDTKEWRRILKREKRRKR